MNDGLPYQLLADIVLSVHSVVVLFVIGGLIFIVIGGIRHWRLARSMPFRIAHLIAIAIVTAQAWLGAVCPLTTLEMWFREQAREATYSGSFIEHWLQQLLYYDLPAWVFTMAYSIFGLLVLAAWWYVPPRSKSD